MSARKRKYYKKKATKESTCQDSSALPGQANKLKRVLENHLPVEAEDKNEIDIDEKLVTDWQKIFKDVSAEFFNEIVKTVKSEEKHCQKFFKRIVSKPLRFSWLILLVRQKVESAKQETVEKLGSQPWVAKLVIVCLLALVFSFFIGHLTPDTADRLVQKVDKIALYPYLKVSRLAGNDFSISHDSSSKQIIPQQFVNRDMMSAYIVSNQDKLTVYQSDQIYAIAVSEKELRGQVAGVDEQAGTEPIINSHLSLVDKGKLLMTEISNYFKNIFSKLVNKQKQLSLDLDNKLTNYIIK